jgi:uncharacterized membrane protein HdeD (DUF308 family)
MVARHVLAVIAALATRSFRVWKWSLGAGALSLVADFIVLADSPLGAKPDAGDLAAVHVARFGASLRRRALPDFVHEPVECRR